MIVPKETLAAILVEQRKELVIGMVALPEKLEIGQVLVDYHFSGICGSQLGEISGVKGPDHWLPHLLGHEASGTVIAIGPGVSRVKPGDKIVAHWRPAPGIQSTTPKYKWNGSVVNAGWVTTFNEYGVASENRLTKIETVLSDEEIALFGCAVTTGFGVIDNNANLKLGDTVVVFGSGGIGLNMIQAAHLAGATKIVAVDKFDNRLNLAKSLGATTLLNSTKVDIWVELERIFKPNGPTIFIDNTGDPCVIKNGFSLISNNGKLILVGVPNKGEASNIYTLPLHFGKSIIGSHGGDCKPESDIPKYIDLVETRKLFLKKIITDTQPLSHINQLIEGMRNGSSDGRCLVNLNA